MLIFRSLRLGALAAVSLVLLTATPVLARQAPIDQGSIDQGSTGAGTSTADAASGGLATWAGLALGAAAGVAVALLVVAVVMRLRYTQQRRAVHPA